MFCCVLMAIQVTPLINQTLKMCLRQFWSRHQEAKANSASLAEFFFHCAHDKRQSLSSNLIRFPWNSRMAICCFRAWLACQDGCRDALSTAPEYSTVLSVLFVLPLFLFEGRLMLLSYFSFLKPRSELLPVFCFLCCSEFAGTRNRETCEITSNASNSVVKLFLPMPTCSPLKSWFPPCDDILILWFKKRFRFS